ncbi:MAG: PAS domain S-box protein [Thermovirga sp.]|nr:PAS domain S-box protein [Thermovirga sp.]
MGHWVDMKNGSIKILSLELDKEEIEKIARYLEKSALFNFAIDTTHSLEEASGKLSRYDVILLGHSPEGVPAFEVVKKISETAPGVPIVVLVGDDDPAELERCLSSGATFCLVRNEDEPFIPKALLNAVLRKDGASSLLQHAEPMVVVDKNRTIKYANKSAQDLLGERVAEGETLSRFADNGHIKEMDIVRQNGRISTVEISEKDFVWDEEPVSLIKFKDVTWHKRKESVLKKELEDARKYFDIAGTLLVVLDNDGNVLMANKKVCEILGCERDEILGKNWFDSFFPQSIKEKMKEKHHQINNGELDLEVCKELPLFTRNGEKRLISWHCSLLKDSRGNVIGTLLSGEDVTDIVRARTELEMSHEKLNMAFEGIIKVLNRTMALRDPYTAGHQERVSQLACAIAKKLGLDKKRIEAVRLASLVHDIGKIAVPVEILTKTSSLSEIEFAFIKVHPKIAYDILSKIEFPWPIAEIVLQHHERLDGSGYPQGLKGDQILLEARILAVADVVEAMSSHRPYRPALSLDEAIKELLCGRGKIYDPEVVDACVELISSGEFAFQ